MRKMIAGRVFARNVPIATGLIFLLSIQPVLAQSIFNEWQSQPETWRPSDPVKHGIDAKGDLGLSVPLLVVPGRNGMDFPVSLSYQSGIRVTQSSGWVGLGWSFDPGSITRDVQSMVWYNPESNRHEAYNVDFADVPEYQPDAYYVSSPSGSFSMSRINRSGIASPPSDIPNAGFAIDEWSRWKIETQTGLVSTTVPNQNNPAFPIKTGVYNPTTAVTTQKADFTRFVLTDAMGTRYVFEAPTLATFNGMYNDAGGHLFTTEYFVNTWRLVSVLGPDYTDSNLIPGKTSKGSWVLITYSDPVNEYLPATYPPRIRQTRYVKTIETPTHRAVFNVLSRLSDEGESLWQGNGSSTGYLESVSLYTNYTGSNQTLVRKVKLEQNRDIPGLNTTRYSLQKIRYFGKNGSKEEPGFNFAYNSTIGGGTLTDENQSSDDFGFYNAGYPFSSETQDGTSWNLTTVEYPSGGKSVFHYENDVLDLSYAGSGLQYSNPPSYGKVTIRTNGQITANANYYITADNNRQGGSRVTRVDQYENHLSPNPTGSTSYAYGDGRASGVPSVFFARENSANQFFRPTSRGKSAVYYEFVEAIHPDGSSETTHYTTDRTHAAAQPLDTIYLIQGVAKTVISGNSSMNWGIPWKTVSGSGIRVVENTSEYSLGLSIAGAATPYFGTGSSQINPLSIYWRPAGIVNRVTNETRIGQPFDAIGGGTAGSVTTTTEYSYNRLFQRTYERTWGAGIPTLFTERIYGYETGYQMPGYSALKSKNQYDVVVRTDIGEELGSTKKYHRSQATTWKAFGSVWHPHKSYSWLAPDAGSRPVFSFWATTSSPGQCTSSATCWVPSKTVESYDDYGRVSRVTDANGSATLFYYGNNSSNCSSSPSTFNRAYLTCVVRQGTTGAFEWKMDYDSDYGTISSVTNENNHLINSFVYDDNRRIVTVKDGTGATIRSFSYTWARNPASGGNYSSTRPNAVESTEYPGSGANNRINTAFFDGLARAVQAHQRDGSYDIISATAYDEMGRPYRTYKPYRQYNSSHQFRAAVDYEAKSYYDGSPGPRADGFPYDETEFDEVSRPSLMWAPGKVAGQRTYQETRYLSDYVRDVSGNRKGWIGAYEVVYDEERQPTYLYRDALGRTYLKRGFAEKAKPAGVPSNQTVYSAAVVSGSSSGSSSFASQGGGTDVPTDTTKWRSGLADLLRQRFPDRRNDDSTGVTTNATSSMFWDRDDKTFSVPETMLVRYEATLSANTGASARVLFFENGSSTSLLSFSFPNPALSGWKTSGTFVAYPGVQYKLSTEAGARTDIGGNASVSVSLEFSKGTEILAPVDTWFEFDAVGQTTKVYSPNYFEPPSGSIASDWTTTYRFDTMGRQTESDSPDAGTKKLKYDLAGNLRYLQDANQAAGGMAGFIVYDDFARVLRVGTRSITSFASLNPFADPDAFETNPSSSGMLQTSEFDAAPNLSSYPWSQFATKLSGVTWSNPKGKTTATAYRVQASPAKWQIEAFEYDNDGRVARKHQFTEDDSGFVPSLVLSYTYNRLGEPVGVERFVDLDQDGIPDNGERLYEAVQFDNLGRLNKEYVSGSFVNPIAPSGTPKQIVSYNANGQVNNTRFDMVGTSDYIYNFTYTIRDWAEQIESITSTSSTNHFAARYTHLANGNIAQAEYYNPHAVVGTGESARYRVKYGYDHLHRIRSADYDYYNRRYLGSSDYDISGISYDKNGNITGLIRRDQQGAAIDDLDYTYGRNNRIVSVNDVKSQTNEKWDAEDGTFLYDANGNMTRSAQAGQTQLLEYDQRNLPIRVMGNVDVTYNYNAAGQRIKKSIAGIPSEHYLMDGTRLIAVLEHSGSTWNLRYWRTSFGRMEPSGSSLEAYYYLTDHMGSTRTVIRQNGGSNALNHRSEAFDYYPFGLVMPGRSTVGSGTKEGYTGKESDEETGLMYFGARYYIPALGRWAAVDPHGTNYPDQSPYTAFVNSPISVIDPDGRDIIIISKKDGSVISRIPAEGDDRYYRVDGAALNRAIAFHSRDGKYDIDVVLGSLASRDQNFGSLDVISTTTGIQIDVSGSMRKNSVLMGEVTVVIELVFEDGGTFELDSFAALAGGHGRGAPENGEYTVNTYWDRGPDGWYEPSMNRDGVGYSFFLNPKFVTGRTYLRVHPDGGDDEGTEGCVGLTGNAKELERFRDIINRHLEYQSSIPTTISINGNPNNSGL